MWNLLEDPLLQVRTSDSEKEDLSLAHVLAGLSAGRIEGFPRVLPHQKQAWHAFLVQLAAMALNRHGVCTPTCEAVEWLALLRNLTPEYERDEPWQLVVEDLSAPAFFQPPVPEKTLKKFVGPWESPDDITVLVTAKNHDVKLKRVRFPSPEHWVYALVTLQTLAGYSGKANYGIARMNGGYGSRVSVGIEPRVPHASARFRRDLATLLDERRGLVEKWPFYVDKGGIALLWLEPWDGTSQLRLGDLDPYFVEVCRRVRLIRKGEGVAAHTATTATSRLAGAELRGNLGDPWIPISVKDGAALTVPESGFSYDRLQRILFSPEFEPASCQRVRKNEAKEEISIHAHVLTRGQGKTDGLHEKRLPIPSQVRLLLVSDPGRRRLGEIAKTQVDDVRLLKKRALKPALLALVQGGPEKIDMQDDRCEKWLAEFDRLVDAKFFEHLWASVDLDEDEARRRWQAAIDKIAREDILAAAEKALPVPTARRFRGLAAAERMYKGSVYKNFRLLRSDKKEAK